MGGDEWGVRMKRGKNEEMFFLDEAIRYPRPDLSDAFASAFSDPLFTLGR